MMRKSLNGITGARKDDYPGLPEELQPLNYYVPDGGRCIMAVPWCLMTVDMDHMDDYEVALPVRFVLEQGYEMVNGYAVVDVPYDRELGAVVSLFYYDYDARNSADMEELLDYPVGSVIPGVEAAGDGVRMGIVDQKVLILVAMKQLTADEIAQFQSNKPVRLGLLHKRGQMMLLMKFGTLNWMDTPYDPHIGTPPQLPKSIPDGASIEIDVVLADTDNGQCRAVRRVLPPTSFARELLDTINEIQAQPFDKGKYDNDRQELIAIYATREMLDDAKAICRVE